MNNKRLNKTIFTGVATVALFAPLVLHSAQASASDTDNSANQVKLTLQSKNFNQFTISGATNLDPNSMQKNDLNSMPGKLKEFFNNYQNLPSNLKQSQTNQMKQALKVADNDMYSNIQDKDVMSSASALNQLAGNVNNAAYESGIVQNKADTARNFLKDNNSNGIALTYAQSIYGPSLNDISNISDTNALTVVGSLYAFAHNNDFNNVQKDINDYSVNQYKTLFNGNDVSGNNNAATMYNKANDLNNLANAYNSNKSSVDNANEKGKNIIKSKADAARNFLKDNNSNDIALTYAQSIYGSSLNDINNLSDTNALTVVGSLYAFAYNNDFNNVQKDINDYSVNQYGTLFNNNDVSGNNNVATMYNKANDLNNLANTYNSSKSSVNDNNNKNGKSKEDSIKDVLNKSSYKLKDNQGNQIDTSKINTDDLQNKLSTFANSYNQINDLGDSSQFTQLKQMIGKIDGSDLSGKSVDEVIDTGIKMNDTAQSIKDINVPQSDTNTSQSNNNSYGVTTSPISNNNSNTNNSNYTVPKINDGSKATTFPATPTTNTSYKTNKAEKTSAKDIKNIKASVKNNKKQLNKINKELKVAKSKSHKTKLNKELKQAKKAFAKSEVKLNHAKHAVK